MTEPLPLSHATDRPGKDELLAVLRVEKALYAALEAETRSPSLGRIGNISDAADAMRISRARITILQRLHDRVGDEEAG